MNRGSPSIRLERLFAVLADPIRLRLLNLMAGREVCVCHLAEILGQNQPKISRHLATLRQAGLVAARREGKWMHYRICPPADPPAASVLAAALAALDGDRQMRTDRSKLERSRLSRVRLECACGAVPQTKEQLPKNFPGKKNPIEEKPNIAQ